MKLAISSSACAHLFESGELTQLEFIDAAARAMACDGVVLDVRHFPRLDDDYLAQVKKMAADLGLCVAALVDERFWMQDEAAMRARFAQALAVGAPLLATRLAAETERSWSDQLAALGTAAGLAKAANVTLAIRNAPGTFAASAHDCKRVAKETDSAWLRFGLEVAAFDAASEWTALLPKTVLAWEAASGEEATRWADLRGFVALDDASGALTLPEMNDAMRRWRIARANQELNRI